MVCFYCFFIFFVRQLSQATAWQHDIVNSREVISVSMCIVQSGSGERQSDHDTRFLTFLLPVAPCAPLATTIAQLRPDDLSEALQTPTSLGPTGQ